MRFELVTAELKSKEPKEVAKIIFDFFVWQSENAIRDEIAARCDHDAAIAANEAATRVYQEEKEKEFGWGPKLPYNTGELKIKEMNAIKFSKNRDDAKTLLNFVRDRLLDKWI